jgi:hypothetical protein
MKKSEIYNMAMLVIVDSTELSGEYKLEILDVLMSDKSQAEWCENREAEGK